MLPTYGFDWPPVPDDIDVPLRKGSLRIDYEWGTPDLGMPPPAQRNVLWTFRLLNGVIQGTRNDLPPVDIYTDTNISEFGVTFDRDMRPVIVYRVKTKETFLRHWDEATKDYIIKTLPAEAFSPRITYDLKDNRLEGTAEVIVAYMIGKDIHVLQSSKGYERPRLAASYLQEIYLDQIAFAKNNRLRFIVYQLTRPEDVPTVNPVPQSKYSTFIYRRQYNGTTPVIPSDHVIFTSAGLKYHLEVTDPVAGQPSGRIYPLSICLRPEYVDELIANGQQNKPILEIKRIYSIGKDSTVKLSLAQLGTMVYDNILKLYRFVYDYKTEGTFKRNIVVNFTDLIVGERTTLVIDEDIKEDDAPVVTGDLLKFGQMPQAMIDKAIGMVDGPAFKIDDQYIAMLSETKVEAKGKITIIDPAQWADQNLFPALMCTKTISIRKDYLDSLADTDVFLRIRGEEIGQFEDMQAGDARAAMAAGRLVEHEGYYWLLMQPTFDNPAKGTLWLEVETVEQKGFAKATFLNTWDTTIMFSPREVKFKRPSEFNPPLLALGPESKVEEELTPDRYFFRFEESAPTWTGRSMSIDVYLPKSFFYDEESIKTWGPDSLIIEETHFQNDVTVYDRRIECPPGIPGTIPHRSVGFYFVITVTVDEIRPDNPMTQATDAKNRYFRRKHDDETISYDVTYQQFILG